MANTRSSTLNQENSQLEASNSSSSNKDAGVTVVRSPTKSSQSRKRKTATISIPENPTTATIHNLVTKSILTQLNLDQNQGRLDTTTSLNTNFSASTKEELSSLSEQQIPDAHRPLVIDTNTPSYNTESSTPVDEKMETKSLAPQKKEPEMPSLNAKPTPEQLQSTRARKFESVEDDFFSMFTPRTLEPEKKKKKKKKVKKTKTDDPGSPTEGHSDKSAPASASASFFAPDTTSEELKSEADAKVKKIKDDEDDDEDDLVILDEISTIGDLKKTPAPIKRNIEELDHVNVVKELEGVKKQKLGSPSFNPISIPSFKRYDTTIIEDDFEEEDEILRKLKTNSITHSLKRTSTGVESKKSGETAPVVDRTYILKIMSHLPGSFDEELEVKAKGSKRFSSIITKTLQYLVAHRELAGSEFFEIHQTEEVVLMWNENEITVNMKPDTLQIPPNADGTETAVKIDLFTRYQTIELKRIKEEKERKEREQRKTDEETEKFFTQLTQKDQEVEQETKEDLDILDDDDLQFIQQQASRESTTTPAQEPEEEDNKEYFKIHLKAEGNFKLTVKVRPQTKFVKLVEHFLSKKELSRSTKVKLIFDDEPIDLSQCVGDTELEDDFTIDVHIVK